VGGTAVYWRTEAVASARGAEFVLDGSLDTSGVALQVRPEVFDLEDGFLVLGIPVVYGFDSIIMNTWLNWLVTKNANSSLCEIHRRVLSMRSF